MASNKKAQILAAVMCASSIFGSYTVVSAADTPTKIESTDKNSSVTANGSTITATAGAQGSQQSTITLGNKSLAINVGKQTTTDGITYGAFTLNSSNLAVNNSGLSVKNTKGIVVGSISNTGAITGTGLTIKNGTGTTLASLNNNGLNIYDGINTKATATITKAGAITGTGLTVKAVSDTIKPEGDYVESKVTTSGVADTIKQGGFTRATSNVAINSIKDTIYTNDGKELSSSNISKSISDATESGSVTLIANKITTNDDATTTTLTSKLNLTGDSATLTSGTAYVKVDNTLGNVTLSGNNATLSGSTFTLKDANGKTATLNTSGLTLKDANGTQIGGVSAAGAVSGTSLSIKAPIDPLKPNNDYIESKVTTSGVADTIKQGGFTRATSNVAINSIKDTIYTNDGKELSSSNISKSISDATESGSVTLIANKITTNDDATTTTLTSKLNLTGDSATLTSGTAYVKVDNTLGNVTLSGNNATLSGSTFTLKDANGKTATLNTSGLTLKDANGTQIGGVSAAGAVSGTSLSIKAPIDPLKPNNDYIESKVTTSGVADTIKQGGFTRATSNVAINSIKDTIYTNDGKELSSSNISKSISDATESGSVTLIANKITTNDDATTTTLTSKLNLTGDSATLTSGTAYVKVDNTLGNVTLSGNNATLSGSTFTLKDANGKTATLNTSGLTLKDEDGNTTGGISSTGAITGTSLRITTSEDTNGNKTVSTVATNGVTDTVTNNKTNNKTTSQVSANGVTDTVYGTDGTTKVASSSVSTSGISNTTSLKTTTGKIDTAINQNTSGVGISSTKYDTNNNDNVTDKTSVSVNGGTSSITSYGSYIYGEDGKATSYNQVSMSLNGNTGTVTIKGGSNSAYSTLTLNEAGVALSGKNASLSGSTFTLKDTTNGKTLASLGASGLSLNKVNSDETTTNYGTWNSNGLTVNGTGYTTIKSTNATTGAMGQSQVSYNGVTDTVTNAAGNKTTSQVSATGVTDRVYGSDGTTQVAYSNVGTGGITNSTNISGIAIKDDEYNTKTMNTSIAQNANGVNISSTKYNVYNDGTSKVQTIDGISTISVNGAKTTISGSGNYEYKKDENGKLILDDKGNPIRSSNTSASLSVDGDTGTISLSGKNASLSNSTFTLKDITSGKSVASLGTSGLSLNKVNSDGTTANYGTWNSSGLTVTATNTTGNKTTSQVSATGVTDRVYDTDGTTQVAYSNVGTSGISNTTTNLQMTGANAGNTMSTALNQNSAGITASATKKAEDGSTIGTSTLTLGGNSASLKVGNYGFAVDSNNNVSIAGNNATLSGSTFTLKDANGKTATLNTSGLTLKDEDGNTTGGISSTGAITGTSLRITTSEDTNGNKTVSTVATNAVTDTVTNTKTNNKTTSQVSATGVTDTVYGTDGTTQVAYSSVGTGGISNTTSLKTDTGKIDTAINQNKSGVSISSTAYSGQNLRSGNSSVSVNGAKTTISSSGGYEYSSDGEVLKYNTASLSLDGNAGTVGLSGKNVSLTNTDLTLKNVETGKAYVKIGSNGLNIYNDEGTSVFGVTRTGAINIDKNVTIDDSYTKDGYTYTASNSISGSNGIRNVATKKDESGKTIATSSSTVTTSGITNSTNISGIAIKDDKNNTKTMNTSIAQNANGVSISSTKYNVYSDGTNTIQTTDGTSSISVNGAKTTISGYGSYEYERDESGKLVVSSRNSASLSVDGESGIIGLSGKNVGLNANGLTLYKDVDGVKTQYASLSAGGLDVKGTGSTTIKSTNATTGAIGQSQVSYNGVTDSFTKDDVTNSVTTNANGTTFSSTGNGSTTIKGDTIKTTNLIVNGKDIGGVATDVAGIDRNTENEDGLGYYTQIEGKTKIYNTGRFSTANGNFVVDPYGSITSKAGNYRFNMDRTNGFDLGYAATTSFTLDNTGVSLGFRNNSFILDKNGATFINANGENVSFTSINGGTITTGETVINGSSITTKDLYVDNIHLNGAITDGNGNVVGGGDLSLGADGTLDLKYNANGITNTFVSGATGVHSSFSNGTTTASSSVGYIDDKNTIGIKDQVGNTSVTTTTDGTTFANGSGSTTINGGNITTTGDVTVGGDLSVGDNFKVDGTTGNVTGGTYNGVQISTDKDGNAIIGGTNIGDLATNEEVNKVNDKVDAVDNKVGDTSKLDKEITDNQNYKDNQNLVGAVNAEADIRRNEISRIDGQIEQLDGRVGSLENRMSDVEDRIDKVGAMSAAIANLRTMGFDPEAPTEIAIGVGQYKSETGLALGVFHYPNQDFMLSASISTSGDEVMGGIGATWKLGRKSAAEKAKDEEARRLEKAEEMKKLAQDAKVKAQAERHAKLLAEREAQKTA